MRMKKRSVTEERAYLVDLIEDAAGERLPEAVRWILKRAFSPRGLEELRVWVTGVRSRDAALISALLDDPAPAPPPASAPMGPVEFEPEEDWERDQAAHAPKGVEFVPEEGDPGYEPPPVRVARPTRCPDGFEVCPAHAPRCPDCQGDLGGHELGRLEDHAEGCPRFPL